jgi:hypothetical protein
LDRAGPYRADIATELNQSMKPAIYRLLCNVVNNVLRQRDELCRRAPTRTSTFAIAQVPGVQIIPVQVVRVPQGRTA